MAMVTGDSCLEKFSVSPKPNCEAVTFKFYTSLFLLSGLKKAPVP